VEINTVMSPKELNELNYKVDAFNKELKEKQKIVSKGTLEEADFLKLLITQLKTQDPTKPIEDKEFITQMAQFTSLKQMNQVSESMKSLIKEFAFTKALGLVNKVVFWIDDLGNNYSGVVESIKVKAGETFLVVDGKEIPTAVITEVRDNISGEKEAVSKVSDSYNESSNNLKESNVSFIDEYKFSRS